MQKLLKMLRDRREAEQKYLTDGRRAIAKQNIVTLTNMSLAIFVISALAAVFGLLLTPGPADEASGALRPCVAHLVMIPVMLAFYAVSAFFGYKGKAGTAEVGLICLIFELTVYGFVAAIDIFAHPDRPACFMPLVMVALSAGLYFSTLTSYLMNIGVTAVYIILDVIFKSSYGSVWRYDVFFALVGFCAAVAVGEHVRGHQVSEFVSKMRYKLLSMRDPMLENIYNKRGYGDAIDNYLIAHNPKVRCAFIVLDLNDFKRINDNYGHDMGDCILKCMSDTLVSLFRDTDIIGRFGGDEFIVLADGLNDETAVEKKCHSIAETIAKKADGYGVGKVYSSIGVVLCDAQNVDFDRLFQIADEAMYEAKEMGRDTDRFTLRHYSECPKR